MAADKIADQPKKKGRPPHTPTPETRDAVARLAATLADHASIAKAIGVSAPTLRARYADELANRLSAENLFAASSTDAPPAPALAAAQPLPRRDGAARGGRAPWTPTDTERRRVSEWIAAGLDAPAIAARLGRSAPTIRRAFKAEFATAHDVMRAEVITELFRTARRGNVTAQRELLAIMDRAALDRAERRILGDDHDARANPAKPADKPAEKPGKKQQAQAAAEETLANSRWADLLSESDAAPPAIN